MTDIAEPFGQKLAPGGQGALAGTLALLACMVFFAVDAVMDVIVRLNGGASFTNFELAHLLFEIAAVVALGFGVWVIRSYAHLMRQRNQRNEQTLSMMRGSFESVLQQRFDDWNLTAAERDVTMLIIKGMSVAEIAAARNTASGTVKAQSSGIFRKIGVSSKTELMSAIIDEFLGDAVAPAP